MGRKTLLTFFVILALLSTMAVTEDCNLFDQFVIDYKKHYMDEAEK